MDIGKLNILLLKDTYNGAYDSFETFYEIIKYGFIKLGNSVYEASSVDNAVELLDSTPVDFTVNIGKYHFYYENEALYERYQVLNYQWIIDNPIRYGSCDTKSAYNRLIFIDANFAKCPGYERADFMWSSLPFYDTKQPGYINEAIIAPMKLIDEQVYYERLRAFDNKAIITDFIDSVDFDESFLAQFLEFWKQLECNDIKAIFEITNGLIRARKRLKLLSSIKEYPVVVFSARPGKEKFNRNITFVEPCNYSEIKRIQAKYKFVLNCNPNFDVCMHDRVTQAISSGRVVLSDKNKLLNEIEMPLCVDYANIDHINEIISMSDNEYERVWSAQNNCINKWEAENVAESIIMNFREVF